MKRIILFIQISTCLSNRIDILQSRGLTIRNHTWSDGAFYSGIENREVHVRMPVPKFPENFQFKNGCRQMDKTMLLPNATHEDYNAILHYIIDLRVRELFYPEETSDPKPVSPADQPIDYFDYFPSPLFAVDRQNIYHGIPKSVLAPDVIFPTHIIVSGMGRMNSVDSITSNTTNTYINFKCDRNTAHYLRFIIPNPIKGMIILLRNGRPHLDFKPNFRVIRLEKENGPKTNSDDLCRVARVFGQGKQYQAYVLNCGLVAATSPVQAMLSMDFSKYCEYVRLVEFGFYPAKTDIKDFWMESHGRKRRQFGEILGLVGLATGLSSWGSTWFWHSSDNRKIKNLTKNTKLAFAHEEEYDKTFNKDLSDTALVNNYTKSLVTTLHKELCSFETLQTSIKLEHFIDKLAWKYLDEVESTLTHAAIPIEGNSGMKSAIQLCRSRNKDSLAHLCLNFYSKNNKNYRISSVHFEREEGIITNAVLAISVNVPKFLPTELMTIHRIMKVPIPLFVDDDQLYHFSEYIDLPEIFGHFPSINRRISLTNCKLFDETYFCPANLLNRLYSSESTCLNTVFGKSPSCKRRLIRSYASCIADSDKDMLLLSHIGPVNIAQANANPSWTNVQKYFKENTNQIKNSNISVFAGEAALTIRCTKSEFFYAGESPVVINFLALENTTEKFPTMHSNLEGMESMKISDKKYNEILAQMDHVDDAIILDQIKLKKLANNPDFYSHSPFDDDTTSNLEDWALPVLAVVTTLSLMCSCWCCWKNCNSCCPTRNRLKAEYSVAKETLCTRDRNFMVHDPSIADQGKSIPVTRRFATAEL